MTDKELEINKNFSKKAGLFLLFSIYYASSAKELLNSEIGIGGVFPAIFCLRNSIELLQKGVLFSLGEKPDTYHHPLTGKNLNKIKDHLPKIDNFDKYELVQKFYKKFSKDTGLKNSKELFQKDLMMSISQIETLAIKYQNYSFLRKEFEDPKNDKARFPDDEEFYKVINIITPAIKLELIKDAELVLNLVFNILRLDDNALKNISEKESDIEELKEFLDS